jgi:DNA-binding transcriptional LysR family regulator
MHSLRLFCDVAALRSFSKTAELHGITQSAVSQRIQQLEEKLGVELIDRSVRPPELTPPGEVFAREGRELIDRYDDLERRVAAMNGGPEASPLTGEVVVAAIYSAGIDLLQALKESFESRHPGVAIRIDYKRPDEVDNAVRSGACDFGIVSYPRRWKGVEVRPLRDERMSVVCPPHHRLAVRRDVAASDLDGLAMMCFDAELPVARHIKRYLRENGAEPEITQEVDNIDTLKSLLEHSDEFAILPRRTVRREAEDGTLVVVELEPELNRPLGIISAKRARLDAAAQSFQDFLVEHADPDARREPVEMVGTSIAVSVGGRS